MADAQQRRQPTAADPDLKVKAVAGQFQWTFDYLPADGNPTRSRSSRSPSRRAKAAGSILPAGQTTHLYLTSPDVIHAFYVPQFLFKRDVVPGLTNEFDLKIDADTAGQTFRGQCAELCGTGHRIMLFEVHSLAPADFEAWYDAEGRRGERAPPPAPSGGATGPSSTSPRRT